MFRTALYTIAKKWKGFPGGSMVKKLPDNARVTSSISGSGRSLGEGNSNECKYSCLENPMDRGDWCTTDHGIIKESAIS